MKVAVVQFAPAFANQVTGPAVVTDNLRKLVGFVQEAAQKGAKLVVLPELATTGYSFMSRAEAATFAESIPDGRTFKVMQALAERLNVHIVWGMIERVPQTGKIHNSQVLVAPNGQWVSYQKVNPWGNDWLWADAGRANPPVLSCDFGEDGTKKVGLLICRDVRDRKDDKWTDFYESGDADLVAFSANWGNGGFPAIAWIDFVRDNHMTLLVSNRYGKESHNDFGHGGICVIKPAPFAIECDGLVWDADCIVYADV